jgi:hypothetical protein
MMWTVVVFHIRNDRIRNDHIGAGNKKATQLVTGARAFAGHSSNDPYNNFTCVQFFRWFQLKAIKQVFEMT